MIERASELNIVGISGSLRPGASSSQRALEHAMALLACMGCQTHIVDLREERLPFCTGDRNELETNPEVGHLWSAVSKAHAVVLCTPEYHGSMSGVLKNALDLLDQKHLEGKVVGVISVLGGPANSNALNDLSRIMRWCHAWVIPQQIAIGHASAAFVDGQIRDANLRHRFEEFAGSLVRSAIRLHDLGRPAEPSSEQVMNRVNIPASHLVGASHT
jgi:FMN reductase